MKIMNLRRTLMVAVFPLGFAAVAAIASHAANAQNVDNLNQAIAQRPDNQMAQNQQNPMGNQMGNQNSGERPDHPRPDFASAASKLGITEQALKTALGVPSNPPSNGERPPRPDFADAASKLGITETELVEALGVPGGRDDGQGCDSQGQGRPGQPPQ